MHPAPEIADEDHRTGAAEHVAGREQRADQQAAIVNPRQHRRQVLRREVGPEQPVRDDDDGDDQEDDLRGRAQAPPAEHTADEGPAEHVYRGAGE